MNKQGNTYKRHLLLVFWDKDQKGVLQGRLGSLRTRFPTIKVKIVEVAKDWKKPIRHRIAALPTVLLLKDGLEVDRVEDSDNTLLEMLFRKAMM